MKSSSTFTEIRLIFHSLSKQRLIRVQQNHYHLFPLYFPAALGKYGEFERIFTFLLVFLKKPLSNWSTNWWVWGGADWKGWFIQSGITLCSTRWVILANFNLYPHIWWKMLLIIRSIWLSIWGLDDTNIKLSSMFWDIFLWLNPTK